MKRNIAHESKEHPLSLLMPPSPIIIAVMFPAFTKGQTRERKIKWITPSGNFLNHKSISQLSIKSGLKLSCIF
jgi:hypothetical protein